MRHLFACLFLLITLPLKAEVKLEYARNFEIEDFDTHRLITVRNTWVGSGDEVQVYALVPKEAKLLPKLPAEALIVRTPVKRLAILATVFLGPIHDLDLYDSLVGISYLNWANDPKAHELVESGLAKEIQSGAAMDIESMILMEPDLILTSTTGNPSFDIHPQMLRAGLPVVLTAGYMEKHPLGRSEWIKFIAAFYNKDEEAEAIFSQVARRYEGLVELARTAKTRPTVFSNAPYGGVWHVPGGQSYTAMAISDAGGEYVWADNESRGGVPLDFEVILQRAGQADIWLHPSHHDTMNALLSADERFVAFKAVRDGSVFNNTVRVNENGGNDIFERGVSRPDEVLADLIKVFHPDLLPDHEFVFYEQLK